MTDFQPLFKASDKNRYSKEGERNHVESDTESEFDVEFVLYFVKLLSLLRDIPRRILSLAFD